MIYWLKLLRIARPQFLIASLTLYLIGAAWAMLLGAPFDLARLALGYLITLTAQLSVSYSNDYYDVGVDQWGVPSLFSGGSGVLVSTPSLRRPALGVAVGLTTLSLGLALMFLVHYAYPVSFLVYVGVCNLLSWLYSAPPARLVSFGLGEVVMTFFSGILLPGMGYWVAAGTLDSQALAFSFPLVLYGLTFTFAVAIPDEETDRQAKKLTWVARFGRRFGFIAIATFVFAASLFFVGAPLLFSFPAAVNFHLLAWLSLLPLAAGAIGAAWHPINRSKATLMANLITLALGAFLALMDWVFFSAAFWPG